MNGTYYRQRVVDGARRWALSKRGLTNIHRAKSEGGEGTFEASNICKSRDGVRQGERERRELIRTSRNQVHFR